MSLDSEGQKRREFMRNSLTVIPAVTLAPSLLFSQSSDAATPPLHQYVPAFFNEEEWEFILSATDRLIPEDEHGAGALTANVPVFIDKELSGDYGQASDWYMKGPFHPNADPVFGYQLPHTPAALYRLGIQGARHHAKQKTGQEFTDLSSEQQEVLLADLENGRADFKAAGIPDLPSATFFAFLLQNTREGYLSDPMYGGNRDMVGWKMLGFTGARASFREWVTQHDVPYPLGPVSLAGKRG